MKSPVWDPLTFEALDRGVNLSRGALDAVRRADGVRLRTTPHGKTAWMLRDRGVVRGPSELTPLGRRLWGLMAAGVPMIPASHFDALARLRSFVDRWPEDARDPRDPVSLPRERPEGVTWALCASFCRQGLLEDTGRNVSGPRYVLTDAGAQALDLVERFV